MNNLEIDLTKNLGSSSTSTSTENVYIENYKSPKYSQYINLIEKYFNEKKKKKYNSKYDYFVDNDGNFVKEAKESENSKDNQVINSPRYFNINTKLSAVNTSIQNLETKLRNLRESLIDGNKSSSEEFDSVKNELIDKIKEKELLEDIKNYNNNSIQIDDELLDELLKTKLNQNLINSDIYNESTSSESYQFLLKRYVENNLKIISIQEKIRT